MNEKFFVAYNDNNIEKVETFNDELKMLEFISAINHIPETSVNRYGTY